MSAEFSPRSNPLHRNHSGHIGLCKPWPDFVKTIITGDETWTYGLCLMRQAILLENENPSARETARNWCGLMANFYACARRQKRLSLRIEFNIYYFADSFTKKVIYSNWHLPKGTNLKLWNRCQLTWRDSGTYVSVRCKCDANWLNDERVVSGRCEFIIFNVSLQKMNLQ